MLYKTASGGEATVPKVCKQLSHYFIDITPGFSVYMQFLLIQKILSLSLSPYLLFLSLSIYIYNFSPISNLSTGLFADIKLHLVARLQFWIPGECRVLLYCHYSQFHSHGAVVFVRVQSMDQTYLFANYAYSMRPCEKTEETIKQKMYTWTRFNNLWVWNNLRRFDMLLKSMNQSILPYLCSYVWILISFPPSLSLSIYLSIYPSQTIKYSHRYSLLINFNH